MEITQLWTPLNPKEVNRELIKQDLERGLAPNLPYFIVGLEEVKSVLSSAVSKIDSQCSCLGTIWKWQVQPYEVFEVLF